MANFAPSSRIAKCNSGYDGTARSRLRSARSCQLLRIIRGKELSSKQPVPSGESGLRIVDPVAFRRRVSFIFDSMGTWGPKVEFGHLDADALDNSDRGHYVVNPSDYLALGHRTLCTQVA